MKLSPRDKKLLVCLRQNSRLTLTQISRKTNIPISTLYDMLKSHTTKLGMQHTTLVNFSKLGYDARVQIMLRASTETKQKIKAYLASHNNINTVMKVTNGYDYIVEGIFENNKQVDTFMEQLQETYPVEAYEVFYIADDVKREGAFSEAM